MSQIWSSAASSNLQIGTDRTTRSFPLQLGSPANLLAEHELELDPAWAVRPVVRLNPEQRKGDIQPHSDFHPPPHPSSHPHLLQPCSPIWSHCCLFSLTRSRTSRTRVRPSSLSAWWSVWRAGRFEAHLPRLPPPSPCIRFLPTHLLASLLLTSLVMCRSGPARG